MAGIVRVTSLKILGVTMTNKLSASDHVRDVISNCAKSLYALRVIRARGMFDSVLQAIYRSVINAKLLYASSAWWGFTNATDRDRVDGFQHFRCGYCPPTFQRLKNSVVQQTRSSLSASSQKPITYCIVPSTATYSCLTVL